jgi:hypothetical protein
MTSQVHHPSDPQQAQSIHEQIDRILHSSHFNGSELLRNLLSYLAKRTIERPGEPVKEYDLAVDVLGRDAGFDARLDSAVRVHTSRLRAKLAEYYMSEGAADPLVIEVPKGSYHISWRQRNAPAEAVAVEAPAPAAAPPARPSLAWKPFAAGFAAAVLTGFAIWAVVSLTASVPAEIRTFWRPFLGSAPDPIVVFSNHRFVGTSSTSLRPYREGIDAPTEVNDTYSGTGTVMAVHDLSDIFTRLHRAVRLKRAELLTWDEAQTTNLILVGSPEANSRLLQLPPLQYFGFKSSRFEPRLGIGGIINIHPRPGEEAIYYGSGNPYNSDYAVIAMMPGLMPSQRVLVLAGTNTYGVQAAAEFICRPDPVNDLLARLSVPRGGRMPDFEALVEVRISGGVPVHSQLALVRRRQTAAAAH